jgi:O-antigen/teichoic acid export membrane protein
VKSRSSFFFAATPLLSAAIGFFTVPLLTWSMPAQTIAQFGLFQYTCTACLIIATCGFDQAFMRELAGNQNPSKLLRSALIPSLAILTILIIAMLLILTNSKVEKLFGEDADWLIPLLIISVSSMTLQKFGAQQTRMSPRGGGAYFLAELAFRLPLIVMLILTIIYQKKELEHTPFVALTVGSILSATVMIGFNLKTWIGIFARTGDSSIISSLDLFKFGLPLAFAGIIYWGMVNMGTYLTQALHGNQDTAKLVVAISFANIAIIGQNMFSLFWLPMVYKKMEIGLSPRDLENIARKVCAGAAIFFIITVIILHVLQNFLGINYRSVAKISSAICVIPILYTISEVTFVGLMQNRKTEAALIATVMALLVSVISNSILVPFFGASGAASASCISAFAFLLFRTEMSCKYWKKIDRKKIYAGSISMAMSGLISPWIPDSFGPLGLLILIPYLRMEREIIKEIYFYMQSNCKLLINEIIRHGRDVVPKNGEK